MKNLLYFNNLNKMQITEYLPLTTPILKLNLMAASIHWDTKK